MPRKPPGLVLTQTHADCFQKDGANAGRYQQSADREGVITPNQFERAAADDASDKTAAPQDFSLSPRSMSDDETQTAAGEGERRGRSSPTGANNPNAQSKSMSVAAGQDCEGVHNRHPETLNNAPFKVGVSSDKNKKCRRTMEDAHAFVYDFGGVKGQGYFAVFDGHAGKHAAEWCGEHFHGALLKELSANRNAPIPDVLNSTFHHVDQELSKMAAQEGTHSGCTAVTAFLRLEDSKGQPINADKAAELAESQPAVSNSADSDQQRKRFGEGAHREKFKEFFRSSSSSTPTDRASVSTESSGSTQAAAPSDQHSHGLKRTLYTANVGDARAVLCRGGKAVRLTYDHKGSDAQEAKRITDAGGFVMNNRVNGVLAVTRSLGDSSMKEFVVGSPYTTETTLSEEDEFLIIACDGLWDVCEDQEAIDIVTSQKSDDPQEASQALIDFALGRFSSDNLSVMVVTLR